MPDKTTFAKLMTALFSLLSESGHVHSSKLLARRLSARGLPAFNRIDFWTRLCHACRLLVDSHNLQLTPLCQRWLSWGTRKQINHLLMGWRQMVTDADSQQRRTRLCEALKNQQESLVAEMLRLPAYQREIRPIESMSLFEEDHISAFGRRLYSDPPIRTAAAAWQYNPVEKRLKVPIPTQWARLWSLEQLLPYPPQFRNQHLIYDLNPERLQPFLSPKKSTQLMSLLTAGLGSPMPEDWLDQLGGSKKLTLRAGYLLTCCSAKTLIGLRDQDHLRQIFEQIIAPHQVFIPQENALKDLHTLAEAGLITLPDEVIPKSKNDAGIPNQVLIFEMLKLAWFAHIQNLPIQITSDLMAKLIAILPKEIALTALQQAEDQTHQPSFLPDRVSNRLEENDAIVQQLKEAIKTLSTVTITYQKGGQRRPSRRRIAPLHLERRGAYDYLVAFCEKACERRTFRIDRIKSIDD